MPEEFLQGGVCGGSSSSCWINPSTNLFNSSPFGWPSHDQPTIDPKTARSGSVDSGAGSAVSDGSGSVVLMDDGSNNWNPNLLHHNNNYSSMNMIDNCYGQNSFHHQFNSYGYNNNNSSLLQTLFVDTDSQSNHLRQSLSTNYLTNNQAGLCLSFGKLDSMNNDNHLQFNNNSTATSTPDFLASSQPQSVLQSKPILNSFHTKKNKQESKKVSNEPSFKRPRTKTPSPLPTFKVRKEKMGDRITALQQLVSPFGKTDTASVLHEATEYIKFLHDQVGVLTTPYLKNGSTQVQHQHDQQNNVKGETDELQSRGLCLVPISSTFPVAAEAAVTDQLWTPNLGGYFR